MNSHLHDEHGGRHVRVRLSAVPACRQTGPAQAGGRVKVAAHLTFGLVVIAAEQILRLII